jgi:maltooligosyltrehalose trehalohydrolase
VTFRVWAPRAQAAQLLLRDSELDMIQLDHGWWALQAPAEPGDRYGYRIDGGDPRPDPASRRQPDGVHELSQLVDPSMFHWSATESTWRAAPLSNAAIYELHVGTFTPEGTLQAAAEKMPLLADLGITHVEVMPLNGFNGTAGWGYDGVAWYAVHEPYGGPEAFARFVDAAHAAGLAVILDVVYNHLGPSGNYLPDYGPYLTDRYSTPWGDGLNLDGPDSDPVRSFIIGNALQWLSDYRVDGLRLDAVHGLVDMSAVHVLAEMADAVHALSHRLGRPLHLIAESDRCDPLTITSRDAHGQGLDAQWADDLHHAIHTAVTGESDGYYIDYRGLTDVPDAYRRGFLYDGRYSLYRQKTVGAPLGDIPGSRLVTCIQNHDQVGNRAAGERLLTLVGPELTRVAAVLLMASPSTPMLFMGEEYGETAPFQYFTSHPEPELAEAVRNGRREEFASFSSFGEASEVPDPQDPGTVTASTLDWSLSDGPDGKAWRDLWATLLRLRRSEPALGNGRRDLVDTLTVDDDVLAVIRRDGDGSEVLITANVSSEERRVPLPPPPGGDWRLLLDTGAAARLDIDVVVVGPRSAALWGSSAPPLP